jgi:hypothetical protein
MLGRRCDEVEQRVSAAFKGRFLRPLRRARELCGLRAMQNLAQHREASTELRRDSMKPTTRCQALMGVAGIMKDSRAVNRSGNLSDILAC